MHFLVKFLLVLSLAHAVAGQLRLEEPEHCVRISKLVLESNSLSAADRERIIRLMQEKSYPEGEIGERIRQAGRSAGYFRAVVEEPEFSFPTEGRDVARVTVRVNAGTQYRLDEIRFLRATAFPPDELRNAFSQRRGDLFNPTEFRMGLERLRELYGTRGYVEMVATPMVEINESRRTIAFVLEVQEGQAH